MFKFLKRKSKGQSTMEYAILIIIIIAALLSIQMYLKRSVQGGLKSSSDDIGEQFDPGNTNLTVQTKSFSKSIETFAKGVSTSNLVTPESTNIITKSNIINVDFTYWGGK